MTATLHFVGGATQVADLYAGREFVDYIRHVDTPGSEFADGIVSDHQVRTFAIPVQHAAVIEKLVLESAGNKIAATTVAITAEIGKPGASVPAPIAPATAKPAASAAEKPAPAKPDPKPEAAPGAASGSAPKPNAPMGQKFREPKPANTLRVLLVGAGSSHDFPRFFLGTDAEILRASGGIETAATPNLDEALALLPQADVLVLSGNHRQFGTPQFQDALNKFADAGKGVVVLHAGTWRNWPPDTGFNRRFGGGGAKSHGYGEFTVTLKPSQHPLLRGVPATFKITDENYHAELDADAAVEVLAENAPDKGVAHPSVWIVKDPKTRIACITLGHAAEAHENPSFKTLLTNAVKWVGAR